ncbi:MAG: endo-1,4-beta-xylanase, partial [Anaerolineae bacterium]|nr:endo-1,4-beta-xylanase [Phycisphaerae bacterium]
TLSQNGFVGTYIRVGKAGDVSIAVHAPATQQAKLAVIVADTNATNVTLPAGTYFVRVQSNANAPVTIDSIDINGATIVNKHTDANALAAADSYIANFRRGAANVKLDGAAPGAKVHVKLKRHDFVFGTAVGGFDKNELFIDNPPADSDAAKYQDVIKREFNAIVPGNAGKWAYNEKERDVVTMHYIDALRRFAKDNSLKMRMHTLLWNTGQQPQFITDLVDKAAAGDVNAKTELRKQIGERIQYYVRDRANSYVEMDVLNEPYHQSKYWDIFGAEGIADIHRECAQAIKDAGATTKLFVNEYNIFQYSHAFPFSENKGDPFANWYREYVEQIRKAAGPVDGIGVQYYALMRDDEKQPHSVARIFGVMQNLAVAGVPITLTEFGVQTKSNIAKAPKALQETLQLVFGSPQCDGFILWGFWKSELWDQATGAAFFEKDWQPTPVYQAWKDQMAKWTTDEELTVAPDGTIQFTGYFGEYEITVDGKLLPLKLTKGQNDYTLAVK